MTMNLQDVRAAAEDTETLNYCITQDGEEFVKVPPHEMMEMRNYILATIPPDAEQPVTPEWLREVWGCQPMVEHSITYWTFPNCEAVWENKGKWYLSGIDGAKLGNRHEATTLFTALGIQPRGITPKEGV